MVHIHADACQGPFSGQIANLYIARRAFAGCTQLCQFHRVGKSVTWRGPYSRANAFLKYDNLDMPKWVRVLPLNRKDEDKWTDDSYAEPSQWQVSREAGY